ncbi:hypothetical protein ACHAW6_013204 [Cyclotella cf. meneghiniana]
MGCKQSKPSPVVESPAATSTTNNHGVVPPSKEPTTQDSTEPSVGASTPVAKPTSTSPTPSISSLLRPPPSSTPQPTLYHHLLTGLNPSPKDPSVIAARTANFWSTAANLCLTVPSLAAYIDPNTGGTPLHVVTSLGSARIDSIDAAEAAVDCLLAIARHSHGGAGRRDGHGNVPLEGIFSGMLVAASDIRTVEDVSSDSVERLSARFYFRNEACKLLLQDSLYAVSLRGMKLYKIIEALPDDVANPLGPTAEFVRILVERGEATASFSVVQQTEQQQFDDDVLALLYRRFVRQFDQSERFFEGDNSREEVVRHREWFKNAAVNTFNIVELLLRRPKGNGEEGEEVQDLLVHNAVRVGICPPDLLRYIVETNLEAVAEKDAAGNLPLHYAAGYGGNTDALNNIPNSYTKYVIDELLYAYPDGAAVPNADGVLPIALAIESGKKWIVGGVRSLYEAYPPGIEQCNLTEKHPIIKSLSFNTLGVDSISESLMERLDGPDEEEEGTVATGVDGAGGRRRKRNHRRKINKDESHDAIMFVQRSDAAVRDIVTTMWANEEDAGVQMLGCTALGSVAAAGAEAGTQDAIVSVALMGVTSVVNAMKNHPNEPAVQEKACTALTYMAPADGVREVSFAASGAISTVVSAMQAHVADARVQKEACRALRGIAAKGGADRATVVASVSGFTALVNAMGAHPDDVDVQREACMAMEVLMSFPDAYLPDGVHEQSDALLQAAAENFPHACLKPVNAIRGRLVGPVDV